MTMAPEITLPIVQKLLAVVDAGLVRGLGDPIPGQMCVEAAVCYALGLPHSDDPFCVSPALRHLKIYLNDSYWSSPQARTKGMRRLAVAQLGTKDALNDKVFVQHLATLAGTMATRAQNYADAANAAYAAIDAANAAYAAIDAANAAANAVDYAANATAREAAYAARDAELAFFAEAVVQILITLNAPGCQWLYLTEG